MINLYCIYDRLAEKAGPVFHADNDAVAIRGYNRLVERGEIDPDDYQLYRIGEYDEKTMDIQTCIPHVIEVGICPAPKLKAVSVDSKLSDEVKKDLGRTCKNCVNMTSGQGGYACEKNGNSVISPETETCDEWRCK